MFKAEFFKVCSVQSPESQKTLLRGSVAYYAKKKETKHEINCHIARKNFRKYVDFFFLCITGLKNTAKIHLKSYDDDTSI